MKIVYKLFKKNPENRDDIIAVTSGLGIFANVCLALAKVLIGIFTSSIAIVSEGVNNATDSMSSLIALVGAKLARKHPDEKHPFGYGRIEYLVGLTISVLIIVTGCEMILSSIRHIFEPEELNINYIALMVIAGSAIIKFILGTYTVTMGKKADSGALIGVGVEGKNDAFASIITIVSSLAFLLFHVSLDAYAGILVSILILKAGIDLLKDTVGDLLGRPGEHELAVQLYKEIRNTEGILSAVDMMLHNYGPDAWSGSVNVEIDQSKTVGEIYEFLHALQLRIMQEYHVVMVFGIYAVDNENEKVGELRKTISAYVVAHEHIKSFHALYLSEKEKRIYCDFLVDYQLENWEQQREDFTTYLAERYPDYELVLTIETDFV